MLVPLCKGGVRPYIAAWGAEGRSLGSVISAVQGTWRLGMLAVFVLGLVLSPNVVTAIKLARLAMQGAYAEMRLSMIPPERYATEIAAALDANDGTLARSLASLAADQGVAIPPELAERIANLPSFDLGYALSESWNCIANGDFETEAGFACVVATDLTGVGDVRDLVGEGGKIIAGQAPDYFTLGIATAGLGLSVATYSSLGGALPLRAGTSFVKAMHRLGKVPPRMTAEIGTALSRGINRQALDEAVGLATSMRLTELQRPLSRLFNPAAMRRLGNVVDDFGTISKAGGVRAMKVGLEAADSTGDVRKLARVADRFGDRFLGVMKLVGRGVLRLGDLLLTIAGWLVGAALWAWSMVRFAVRGSDSLARATAKVIRKRLVPRRASVTRSAGIGT